VVKKLYVKQWYITVFKNTHNWTIPWSWTWFHIHNHFFEQQSDEKLHLRIKRPHHEGVLGPQSASSRHSYLGDRLWCDVCLTARQLYKWTPTGTTGWTQHEIWTWNPQHSHPHPTRSFQLTAFTVLSCSKCISILILPSDPRLHLSTTFFPAPTPMCLEDITLEFEFHISQSLIPNGECKSFDPQNNTHNFYIQLYFNVLQSADWKRQQP
jgi:hypothetical protein